VDGGFSPSVIRGSTLETDEIAGNCDIKRRLAITASVVRRVVRLRRIVSPECKP
jgi:hypothetical protein